MMRIPRYLFVVVGAVAVAPWLGVAQQAAEPPAPVLHAKAREVQLPVTVRDKHGALVANLTKDDVTLAEDGRAQTIRSLVRESELPFAVGLLVETNRSLTGAMEAERKAADKFVDQMLGVKGGKDQAFLIHFDREVELLQDFTTEPAKLHGEIENMGPTSRSQDDRGGPETTGDDRERTRGVRAPGNQLFDAIFLASDELMKPKEGRKVLVVFSDGVDRGSKESMSEALDAADHAGLSIYTIYLKGEQEHSGGGFPGTGQRGGSGGGGWPGGGGRTGGGGGYPGGGGRRGGGGSDEPNVDGKKIMEQIATRTGGRFFEAKKRENLEEIYAEIGEELRGQYLLTYTPDMVDNDGGFHKVAVKAKKDDLSVLTRPGYYAPGGETK